jgi:hypothetical protein
MAGHALRIVTTSTFAILQAVEGIALKRAVYSWYMLLLLRVKKKLSPFRLQKEFGGL